MGASSKRRKKMKTLTKFVMLLAVLAFCLPADGEILIYTKTMKCFEAEGEALDGDPFDWLWVGDERITGYLILDVVYNGDGTIDFIDDAHQVEYWRDGGERWYEQWWEGYDVERIEVEDRWGRPTVYWVLEDWWYDEIANGVAWEYIGFAMYRGKARMANIGLGWTEAERREVASMLEGCYLYFDWYLDEPDEYLEKGTCCVTLRLHPWWTRLANLYWAAYEEDEGVGWTFTPFWWAVGGIAEEPFLIGGEEEPAGPYGIVKAWLEWLRYDEIDGMTMLE